MHTHAQIEINAAVACLVIAGAVIWWFREWRADRRAARDRIERRLRW